jgi:hypothetical protein
METLAFGVDEGRLDHFGIDDLAHVVNPDFLTEAL